MSEIHLTPVTLTPYQKVCLEINLLNQGPGRSRKKSGRKKPIKTPEVKSKEEKFKKLKEKLEKKQKYLVTRHAIQRFRERVADISEDRIREMLLCENCIKRYDTLGDGKYSIRPFHPVWVYVHNRRVVTVISRIGRYDIRPGVKLQLLSSYMDYVIDAKVEQIVEGKDIKIDSFEKYFKHNFRLIL